MVFGGFAGGGSLGIAQGRLVINTSQLIQAQMQVAQASRQMTSSLNQVGQASDQTSQRLSNISAGLTVLGTAAAYRVQRIESLFKTLSGSEEQAVKNMADLRDMADQAQMPFLELLDAANSLLPVTRRNNAGLRETMSIAQRLAILDPFQGVRGAGIALREFLTGTYISLAMRFELERPRLQRILAESGGDVNKALQGLSEYIDEIGLTQEALEAMGNQGVFAMEALRDETIMAMSVAFQPFLNDVLLPIVSGIRQILQALQAVSPEVLKFAGGMTAALAAASALSRVTGGKAGMFGGAANFVAQAGFLYLITDVASRTTMNLLRSFDKRGIVSIDPRLRADSGEEAGDVIGERLKQAIVILIEQLIQLGGHFGRAGIWIENAFQQIIIGLQRAQLGLEDAFLGIIDSTGKAITMIGGLLGNHDLIGRGQNVQLEVARRRYGELQPTRMKDEEGNVVQFMRLVGGLYSEMRALEERGSNGFAWNAEMEGRVQANMQNARDMILAPIAEALFPELFVEDIIEPISTPASRASQLLAEFGEALTNAGAELYELSEDERLRNERESEGRDISAGREWEDYQRNRLRAIADFQRQEGRIEEDNLRARQEMVDRIRDLSTEADEEQVQRLDEHLKDQRRAYEDHQESITEILRDMSDGLNDAIAERNSAAAQAAMREGEKKLQKENEQYQVSEKRREEDFQATIQDLNKRRDARIREAQQQLQDLVEQQNRAREQRRADFELQMQIQDEERAIRLQRLQEDYAREDRYRREDLIRKQNAILYHHGLNEQALKELESLFSNSRQAMIAWAKGMAQQANLISSLSPFRSTLQTDTNYYNPYQPTVTQHYGGGEPQVGRRVRVGEQGPEWAVFTSPTRIYPAGQTPSSGSGSNGGIILNVDFSGATFQNLDEEGLVDMMEERIINTLTQELSRR